MKESFTWLKVIWTPRRRMVRVNFIVDGGRQEAKTIAAKEAAKLGPGYRYLGAN